MQIALLRGFRFGGRYFGLFYCEGVWFARELGFRGQMLSVGKGNRFLGVFVDFRFLRLCFGARVMDVCYCELGLKGDV